MSLSLAALSLIAAFLLSTVVTDEDVAIVRTHVFSSFVPVSRERAVLARVERVTIVLLVFEQKDKP